MAYPFTVGMGYTRCATCHYNPLGNGPLNDYGRSLAAVEMSAKPLHSDRFEDQRLADVSGFLFGSPLPSWLRPSLDVRGLYYMSNVLGEKPVSRLIPMRADAEVVLKSPMEKVWASLNVGFAPRPAAKASTTQSIPSLISREHYVGWRPIKGWAALLGLTDPIFGVRIPDHNAFSRDRTGMAQNDQVHGLTAIYTGRTIEASLQGFLGNLAQESGLRQKGAALRVDRLLSSSAYAGGSALVSSNSFRQRQMIEAHGAFGFGQGSSLIAELGLIREAPSTRGALLGNYALIQGNNRIVRGLYWLTTVDFYSQNAFGDAERLFRITPGIQYFPLQRLELRVELQMARSFNQALLTDDLFNFLAQLHVYL